MEIFIWAVYCPRGFFGFGWFFFFLILFFLPIKVLSKMQIARYMEVSLYVCMEHGTIGPNLGCNLYLPL